MITFRFFRDQVFMRHAGCAEEGPFLATEVVKRLDQARAAAACTGEVQYVTLADQTVKTSA